MTAAVSTDTAPARRPWINLSPLNQRRWQNFKANKRGYWSLWIFLVLFVLSLFAEFLANDRPILVWFKGGLYSPVMTDYPEEHWLGEDGFLAQTDYKIIEIEEAIAENGDVIKFGKEDEKARTPKMGTGLLNLAGEERYDL